MWSDAMEARWRELSAEVVTGMAQWRVQQPRATFSEIEAALRCEASARQAKALGCGRAVARLPRVVARLRDMVERFLTTLSCVDHARVAADTWEQLAAPG